MSASTHANAAWKPLLPAAMVGTDRPVAWPPAPAGEVGDLLRAIDAATPDPGLRLLRHAAVIAVCGLAADSGVPVDSTPLAAAEDTAPALSDPALVSRVDTVLREGPSRLQHLVLRRLAERGWRLPPALLPLALEVGRRAIASRAAVVDALGERGRWLAGQNDAWRYAAAGVAAQAPLDDRWSHGDPAQRRAALAEERAQGPARARERLAAEWPQLAARERADLLDVLADGLGPDDEDWLDGLVVDRSKEVRQVVAGLLLRMPGGGRFVQRAVRRLEPLLTHDKGFLRSTWKIDAPAEADPAWEKQGLDVERPKSDALGERAWWLYQLARQVPVAWWCERMRVSPAELFAWALRTDWSEALMRAWCDVVQHTGEADAIDALLAGWPWKGVAGDPDRLVARLPMPRREAHWRRRLAQGAGALREVAPALLSACAPGESISPELSDALAAALPPYLADANVAYDAALRNTLPELCCTLRLASLAPFASLAPQGHETPAHAELLLTLRRVVDTRRVLEQLPEASR